MIWNEKKCSDFQTYAQLYKSVLAPASKYHQRLQSFSGGFVFILFWKFYNFTKLLTQILKTISFNRYAYVLMHVYSKIIEQHVLQITHEFRWIAFIINIVEYYHDVETN